DHIKSCHERNDLFGHLGNTLDATDNHQSDGDGQYNADPNTRTASLPTKKTNKLRRSLVALKHVTDSKGSSGAEDCKNHSEDSPQILHSFLGQTFFKVIHGPSVNGTIGADIAICHPQGAFGKFGCHAQYAAENHPKGCSGTTNGNSHAYPGNVSQSHCGR